MALLIVVLEMDVMEEREVHLSCTVEEMGNCRSDMILGDRNIATGAKCSCCCKPPLGFYGPPWISRRKCGSALGQSSMLSREASSRAPCPSRCLQTSSCWPKASTKPVSCL